MLFPRRLAQLSARVDTRKARARVLDCPGVLFSWCRCRRPPPPSLRALDILGRISDPNNRAQRAFRTLDYHHVPNSYTSEFKTPVNLIKAFRGQTTALPLTDWGGLQQGPGCWQWGRKLRKGGDPLQPCFPPDEMRRMITGRMSWLEKFPQPLPALPYPSSPQALTPHCASM